MRMIENSAGVFNARKGRYAGQEVIVTHRDPATGMVWMDNFMIKHKGSRPEFGMWVNPDAIEYVEVTKNVGNASNKRRSK